MTIPKRFLLHISTENAAFDEGAPCEVARLLRQVADKIEMRLDLPGVNESIRDINGNTVGGFVHKRGGLTFVQDKE